MMKPCKENLGTFDECAWKSDVVPDCLPTRCTNRIYARNSFGKKHRSMYNSNRTVILWYIIIINLVWCKIVSSYILFPRKDHEIIKKELYFNGPLQVSMHMYSDFRSHNYGIYYYF